MTTSPEVTRATVPQLALRLLALRGTFAYAAYLAPAEEVSSIIAELSEELVALDRSVEVAVLDVVVAEELFGELADTADEIVLLSSTGYVADDWELFDRRRSSLAHAGVMVFVMSRKNFDDLMRAAPNLASWLGALVFQHSDAAAALASTRERRLVALRSWAHKSDDEIVEAAARGELPADPEYGEWLVLLGRGDLLDRT